MAERLSSTSWGTGASVQEHSSWDTDWSTPSPEASSWGSPSGSSWDTAPQTTSADWGSWESELTQPPVGTERQNSLSEKMGELRQRLIHSFGRKALDAVMGRLPRLGGTPENIQNTVASAYENSGQLSAMVGNVQSVVDNRDTHMTQGNRAFGELARESAVAAKGAALEAVKDYYGIETDAETGERKIRKLKLARAAIKTVVMPVGVGTKVARKATVAGAKEALQTGRSGFSEATRATFAQPSAYESPEWTAPTDNW